jgi:hypothetical protein
MCNPLLANEAFQIRASPPTFRQSTEAAGLAKADSPAAAAISTTNVAAQAGFAGPRAGTALLDGKFMARPWKKCTKPAAN